MSQQIPQSEPVIQVKYIVLARQVVKLTRNVMVDMYWRDADGTVFSYAEGNSYDPIVRCGVGFFSFAEASPLTPACKVHDYKYTDTYYQAHNKRSAADAELYTQLRMCGASKVTAGAMWLASRIAGFKFWDTKETND